MKATAITGLRFRSSMLAFLFFSSPAAGTGPGEFPNRKAQVQLFESSGKWIMEAFIRRLNIEHYQRLLTRVTDEDQRAQVLKLLAEIEAKQPSETKRASKGCGADERLRG